MKVTVPYDSRTGEVYLNSLGANVDEAYAPIVDGSLGVEIDDIEHIDFVEGEIELEFEPDDDSLFPVYVPLSKQDGKPVIKCAGSTPVETRVNLSYASLDEDGFFIVEGRLRLSGFDFLPETPAISPR